MGEEASQIFQDMNLKKMDGNDAWCSKLTIMVGGNNETMDSISIESSFENSENSISSISSSDLVEDAASATSSSSSSLSSNGPLYELSELMAQLPIRRGLSKHYQGKSQSFTSLARVRSIEDLPKKVIPYRVKMKSCKSHGWGLDAHNNKSYSPKATISKKSSRGCSNVFSRFLMS
ncbi:PREDICTED: uncharacterized protein LOC18588493 [Theobroma cacao]|uniref:Uncharacterized protein LOC18588493 n=1 Tax=Theobroma cacao TaxID=3641 RepID=A0AB32UPV9_THECC|nr:PREDICTED: uncharacterized protein LOC18588493 [Theobroma cacao]